MDWVTNAKAHRDNAISVFQHPDSPPQVRARAYLYADVMQHYLGAEAERPACIPSLMDLQCGVIGAILMMYVIEISDEHGRFALDVNEFIEWADLAREERNTNLHYAVSMKFDYEFDQVIERYQGLPLSQADVSQLRKYSIAHAFAVINLLIVTIKDDNKGFVEFFRDVPRDEWADSDRLVPLINKNVLAIFSIQKNDEVDEAPSIVGFLGYDHDAFFYFHPDNDELTRLIADGGRVDDASDELENSLERLNETSRTNNPFASMLSMLGTQANIQGQLNGNILCTRAALNNGTYPSLPGVVPQQFIVVDTADLA